MGDVTTTPGLIGGLIVGVAIVCATVAVCLHVIDGATFAGIVGTGLGLGGGAGAHASGVKQGQP